MEQKDSESFYDFFWHFDRYASIAIVIEGVVGLGAERFTVKPASLAAWVVVAPKVPIATSPCLKAGQL